jgi:hypothetical protein
MANNYAANGNGHKRHEKSQDSTKYPTIEVPYNGKLLPKPRGTLPVNLREISITNKIVKNDAE